MQKQKEVSVVTIALWYTISNVLVKGLNVISTPIFTRLLSTSEYGEFSNFTSWESVLFVFLSFQLHATVPRARYDFPDKIDTYLSSITATSNILTLLLYFIVEINQNFFESFFSMDIFYIRVLFILLFFSPAFNFLQIKHRIYNKYKLFVAFAIGSAFFRTFFSVFIVICMRNKLLACVIGYVLPISIINIIIWCTILSKGKKPSWKYIKYSVPIAFPLLQNALAGNLLNTSDRIMIKQFCGPDQTALYTLAYSCASMASLIWTSMNQAWTPWLFEQLNKENYTQIRKSSKWYLLCWIAVVIPFLLIMPEIIYIMGGKSYYEVRYIMPVITVGCVCQFIYGMYVNIETYEKCTWIIVKGTAFAAIINIILNYFLIPLFGYQIAAYTTLIGYYTLMLFHWRSVKSKIKKYANVYDNKFLFISSFILIGCHWIFLFLYNSTGLRYILLGIYISILIFIIYKKRNIILKKTNT